MQLEKLTTFMLIFIPFVTYLAKYLFNMLLAQSMSIENFGDFSIALKTFNLFSALILLGTATSAKRFLAEYLRAHDQATSLHYVHWNLRLISRFSIFFIVLLAILCLGMIFLHFFNLKDIATYHITFYLLFLAPLGALSLLLSSYLQCNGNSIWSNIFSQSGQYIFYAFVLWLAVYFYHPELTNKTLWLLSLSVFSTLTLAEIVIIALYFPKGFLKAACAFRGFSINHILPEWQKSAHRLIANQMLFLVLCTMDLYAVKFCTSNKADVGHYAAVLTISGLLYLLSISVYSPMSSSVSHLLGVKDYESLQKIVNKDSRVNFYVTTCAMLGIVLFGNPLLGLFGPNFATPTDYTALIILSVGYYLGSFTRAATQLLAYSGNELCLVYGSLLELGCITITAVVFTLLYGIIGAAIASSITILLKSFGYITVARQRTSIKSLGFM